MLVVSTVVWDRFPYHGARQYDEAIVITIILLIVLWMRRPRSSSLQPLKERCDRRLGGGRSRAASVEGAELERAGGGKDDAGVGGGVGGGRGGDPIPIVSVVASLHRRVGRCILLLSRFVERGKEEENRTAAGELQ